jgi:hypothetical protein
MPLEPPPSHNTQPPPTHPQSRVPKTYVLDRTNPRYPYNTKSASTSTNSGDVLSKPNLAEYADACTIAGPVGKKVTPAKTALQILPPTLGITRIDYTRAEINTSPSHFHPLRLPQNQIHPISPQMPLAWPCRADDDSNKKHLLSLLQEPSLHPPNPGRKLLLPQPPWGLRKLQKHPLGYIPLTHLL